MRCRITGERTRHVARLLVDAAQELARRLLRTASRLEGAPRAITRAGTVERHVIVHDLASRGEDVERRADVDVALLVAEVKVRTACFGCRPNKPTLPLMYCCEHTGLLKGPERVKTCRSGHLPSMSGVPLLAAGIVAAPQTVSSCQKRASLAGVPTLLKPPHQGLADPCNTPA